jgi:DNA repair photolyase
MARNWGKFVKAKDNIAEVLTKEIAELKKGTVGVSTVTDPYQPAESKFELTRKCLEILSKKQFPVSIQTKSNLVLRDTEVIEPTGFEVGVTITTLNDDIAQKIEPNASSPDSRAQVIDEFHARGVKTWIFLSPIIPRLNDDPENIASILEIARRTKSRVLYDKLNLKNWVIERMMPTLEQFDIELTKTIPELVEANSNWWKTTSSSIGTLSMQKSVAAEPAFQ